ncbi:MAG: Crp/Fnr family transcriptional regulator [Vicinamibacterales bacterium]
MSEFYRLRAYLERKGTFTEEEFAFLEPLFLPRMLRAGEFLQRAGEAVAHGAFVATGCLRKFVLDARGKEHIVQFAPENWWVGEGPGVTPGTPAQYFIDAIEDSNLLLFDAASHQRAMEHIPAYAAGFRDGLQRHAAAKEQQIVNALTEPAEERYEAFLKKYPSIALRVPQFMLASYLGVSPETLSRIRKSRSRT